MSSPPANDNQSLNHSARPERLLAGGVTPRQHDLLNFIQAYIEDEGYSPSYAEMREALGLKSKTGIHRMIENLAQRGLVTRVSHKARSVRLPSIKCPHCGETI